MKMDGRLGVCVRFVYYFQPEQGFSTAISSKIITHGECTTVSYKIANLCKSCYVLWRIHNIRSVKLAAVRVYVYMPFNI